ncbi:MAG: hypothetical protein LBB52_08165 [Desulfovibrio sp.]|jgi:hypothetical protein|nr:hypothetical protein [Desulfovibrio sp.]
MVIEAFEKILNDPGKMAYYNKLPALKAVFLAMYKYKKAGNNFSDLPWFSLSKIKRKHMKKAA